MTVANPRPFESIKAALKAAGQDHVLRFWPKLDDAGRAALLADFGSFTLDDLPNLSRLARGDAQTRRQPPRIEPPKVLRSSDFGSSTIEAGQTLVANGKVCALTVAGGQGTRLGFDGPKGAFPASPIRQKSLFQLFAEYIRATDARHACRTTWYVMTSPANDQATRAFFEQHGHFGLSPDDVRFFQQGVMPAFDRRGKLLLDEPHRLSLSPDGHGGTLLALATTGMLADMALRGIEYISYFQVDNPLVACIDPLFVGAHAESGSEASSKTLPKADDLERVGNFAMLDGKLAVIEYSDLPEELARAKNPDGSRRFDAANIAVHMFDRAFVERLTADRAAFGLPWHRALKKVPCLDLDSGRRIEPDAPNAVKLEAFIFDALPLARNPLLLETSRAEEFSPVKNATGVDSIETARRDMSRRAARWLAEAGFEIPKRADGEPDGVFEISPLLATTAAELRSRGLATQRIEPGQHLYLE